MKKQKSILWTMGVVLMLAALTFSACGGGGGGGGGSSLPYGNYTSSNHDLSLSTNGTFSIVHRPTTYDSRSYTIAGTFTSTFERGDPVDGPYPANGGYGKITLTVTTISSGGTNYSGIEDPFCESSSSCNRQVWLNDVMEGWWIYSANITWGGSFRLMFNNPGLTRDLSPYHGHHMLIAVDPR